MAVRETAVYRGLFIEGDEQFKTMSMMCSDPLDEFLEATIVDVCFAPLLYRIAIEVLRTEESVRR